MAETISLLHKQERRLIGEELRRRVTGDSQSMAQFAMVFAPDAPVDRVALTRAFNAAVARHAALRTVTVPSPRYNEAVRQMQLQTFARTGLYIPGMYEQRPLEHAEVELHERAWSGDSDELNAIAREECALPLDLSVAPALRATMIASEQRQLILVNLSHLQLDLWAVTVLHREIAFAYAAFIAGGERELPPVLQQHDLVAEELAMLRSPEGERHLAYWTAHYAALDDALITPSDLSFVNRTPGRPRFEMRHTALSPDEVTQVHEACRGAADYAFWRTMYGIALGMVANKTRVAFWANLFNRRRPGAQGVLAWCAHPHVLAVDAPWSRPWADVWQQVRSGVRQAQAYERYSWDTVAQRVGRPVGTAGTHLTFDVVPGHRKYARAPLHPVDVPGSAMPVDLSVRVTHLKDDYTLVVTFNSARYSADGVSRLLATLHETIRACAAQPGAKVGDIVKTVRQRQKQAAVPVAAG